MIKKLTENFLLLYRSVHIFCLLVHLFCIIYIFSVSCSSNGCVDIHKKNCFTFAKTFDSLHHRQCLIRSRCSRVERNEDKKIYIKAGINAIKFNINCHCMLFAIFFWIINYFMIYTYTDCVCSMTRWCICEMLWGKLKTWWVRMANKNIYELIDAFIMVFSFSLSWLMLKEIMLPFSVD